MTQNNAIQNEVTPADILEFLKEHMVMREDFEIVKDDVEILKSDVGTLKSDVSILKKDVESLGLRFTDFQKELEDIKESLKRLEERTREDADAVVIEIEGLKKRVTLLEQQLGVYQASRVV